MWGREDDNSPTCALHCKHYFIRYGSLHVVQRNKERKTPISRARKEEDDSSQAESTGQLRNLVIGASSTIRGETEGLLRCTCRDNPMQATYMYSVRVCCSGVPALVVSQPLSYPPLRQWPSIET